MTQRMATCLINVFTRSSNLTDSDNLTADVMSPLELFPTAMVSPLPFF